jgi:membrane associated rhomboid family serine protease
MNRLTPVVKNLLILNVGIFILQGLLPGSVEGALMLFDFRYSEFMPFQLFTHMFLHADLLHLFFNMLWLYFMGPLIEQYIGEKKFIILYVVSGIGAGVLQNFSYMFDYPDMAVGIPSLGASGAVAGVMMAAALKFPNMEIVLFPIPIPIKMKYFVVLYAAYELFQGMSRANTGIAHFAHLGGMIFGAILILLWNQTDKNQNQWR